MNKFFTYILSFALLFSFAFSLPADAKTGYTDGFVKIGEVSIPFPEYMPGTFFTKNGAPCVCHDNSAINCVASGSSCNCLRFVEIDGKEVDLLAVQCIGFARYCFYRLFGFIDHDIYASKFYNAGTLSYGQVSESTVKALFNKLKPGAHIRFKLASSQHSIILLSKSADGFIAYQCNSGGNGVPQADCVISTKTYTWESFANYAYRGIVFAHMPNNYPESLEYSDTPFNPIIYSVGNYVVTDNLKLRESNGVEHEWLDTIPEGTEIAVSEISDNWGKTVFNGKEGWVCLDYARYTSPLALLSPKENSGIIVEGNYIYGVNPNTTVEELLSSFENSNLTIDCKNDDYVGTGTTISIEENGNAVFSAEIIINGDTNGDGAVSVADCVQISNHLNGKKDTKGSFLIAADINGNGSITTSDYQRLMLLLSGLTA